MLCGSGCAWVNNDGSVTGVCDLSEESISKDDPRDDVNEDTGGRYGLGLLSVAYDDEVDEITLIRL